MILIQMCYGCCHESNYVFFLCLNVINAFYASYVFYEYDLYRLLPYASYVSYVNSHIFFFAIIPYENPKTIHVKAQTPVLYILKNTFSGAFVS